MNKINRIVAIIPAKGNSKRLPNKNIMEINGKPMLTWAIKACQESKYNIEPWVSSEDDNILKIAKKYGAKIHKRDVSLIGDTVFKQEVIRNVASHIISMSKEGECPDVFISLQPNSPQICGHHLDEGLNVLLNSPKGDKMYEVFSVDKNYFQNAAYRMFRSNYVMQKDLSTHCAVVVCDIIDINTQEDFNAASKLMISTKVEWRSINKDIIKGGYAISNAKIDDDSWFPTKKDLNNVEKYFLKGYLPKFPFISRGDKIIVFGDCFSQHFVKFFIDNGYNVNNKEIKLYFYNSQFINTFSILEQIEWILGIEEINNIQWFRGTAIRESEKEVILSSEERKKIRDGFSKTNVFMINLGLSEVWFNSITHKSLWRKSIKCPGDNEVFKITSVDDNLKNLNKICEYLKKINNNCKIIFQLSPVPFNATFRSDSVIASHDVSKSILRVSIDEFFRKSTNISDVYYYPSYEMVNHYIKNPYEDDNRHLSIKAIDIIMNYFKKYYLI